MCALKRRAGLAGGMISALKTQIVPQTDTLNTSFILTQAQPHPLAVAD